MNWLISTDKLMYIFLAFLAQLVLLYKLKSLKKRKNIEGRHVVITGGTSGIGLRIAIQCALKGAHVTVIARNVQLLEQTVELLKLKKINPTQKFSYRSLDISTNYSDVENVLSDVEKTMGPIYMLINCAGLAICGTVEEVSVEDAKKLMDINYYGTYYCTRYVLPKMKDAGEGIIVMTGSIASLFGIYGYGPYTAAKFALRGLAETVAMEAKHKGVSVTLALPCDTDTPGFQNEEKTKPKETKIISGSGGLADPEEVAKQILEDALKGSFFSILGLESWAITIMCCGMAPWNGICVNLLQAFLMGPLRIVGLILQWHFSRIIKRCSKEKNNKEIQVSLCNCKFLPKITFEIDEIDRHRQSGNESTIEIMSKSVFEKTIINGLKMNENNNLQTASTSITPKTLELNTSMHELLSLSSNIDEDHENDDANTEQNMNRSLYQTIIKTITPNLKWYLDKAMIYMKKSDYDNKTDTTNTNTFNDKLISKHNRELSISPSLASPLSLSSLNSNNCTKNLIPSELTGSGVTITDNELSCNVKPSIIKKLVTQTHKNKSSIKIIHSHKKEIDKSKRRSHKISNFLNTTLKPIPIIVKDKQQSENNNNNNNNNKSDNDKLHKIIKSNDTCTKTEESLFDLNNDHNDNHDHHNDDKNLFNMNIIDDKLNNDKIELHHNGMCTPYLNKVDISTKKLYFEFEKNNTNQDKENIQKLSNLNNNNHEKNLIDLNTNNSNNELKNNNNDIVNFQLNNFCNGIFNFDNIDYKTDDGTPLTALPFYESNNNNNNDDDNNTSSNKGNRDDNCHNHNTINNKNNEIFDNNNRVIRKAKRRMHKPSKIHHHVLHKLN